MKRKATTRKVVVRNDGFIAVVRESAAVRADRGRSIAEHAVSSGVVGKLSEANKKIAADVAAAKK
jgi:hypothetical protein